MIDYPTKRLLIVMKAITFGSPNSKRMKKVLILLLIVGLPSIMIRCGKTDKHDHDEAQEADSSSALYDEVMKLHDEGMARMDEIHRLKEDLKNKIESAPELVEEKRKDIEAKIAKLDSASRGMMAWMRNFHPEADTLDDETYQEYLESEMERVKKVKDDILDAIARAKEE